jgi:glycosyltransferase involved in cell wall biosynthesis
MTPDLSRVGLGHSAGNPVAPEGDDYSVPYSVVIPVYLNSESLPLVIAALEDLQDRLDIPVEGVFVVDGSPDDSLQVLRECLPSASFRSQLLVHSRNFGAFAAIRTGFLAARGHYVAAMAADLQEPIELIEDFYRLLLSGEWDVAVGTRTSRQDPGLSKALSATYWRAYRRLVQPQMPPGGVDIFACTRQVALSLGEMTEAHSSLVGQLYWVGYRRTEVPYERRQREHGSSAWSLRKKVSYLLDSVFSFTHLPISIVLTIGVVGTALSLVGAIVVFVIWLLGDIRQPGYTATMLVLLLGISSILFALGLVGTYVWRTYENTKARPSSIVRHQETFVPSTAAPTTSQDSSEQ